MSEKKKKTLKAQLGEPLPSAHAKRLIASTIEHGKRVVENQVHYPDPATLTESDTFDPRTEEAPVEGEADSERTTQPREQSRAKGDR